jgi:protoporphyrinogen oxidase
MKVVILGAGPCGLSAAWELIGKGHEIHVIEKLDRPGGLCLTNSRDGFKFDLGGHRIISSNPVLLKKIQGLLGPKLLKRNRKSSIFWNSRFYRYPIEFRDALKKGFLFENGKIIWSLVFARIKQILNGSAKGDLGSWLKAQYGAELYNRFFRPYSFKVWGDYPENLSAAWASQRIPSLSVKNGRRSYAKAYFYPENGIGGLFEALCGLLHQNGVNLHFSAEPLEIRTDRETVKGLTFKNSPETGVLDCDAMISTIPITALAESIGLQDKLKGDLRFLKFRAIRFLNIMLDCEQVSDNTWIYVPDPRFVFTRIQEPKKRSPHNAPPGKTSMILEIPCTAGDKIWNMEAAHLFSRCMDDLSSLGFKHLLPHVTGHFDTRCEYGYPVSCTGTQLHRMNVLHRLSQFENLVTCGRQGTFRYIFMDQAMEMGRLAALRILGQRNIHAKQIYELDNKSDYFEGRAVCHIKD